MSQDQEQKTFDIYVDETSKNSPFMGVGALFTRKDSARSIAQMIQETIDGFGDRPDRELHWTKLKNHQLPLYKAVAVKLMACTQVKPYRMRFNALIVETSKIDRSISEGANREIILSKFMFGLIFQMASNFGVNNRYRVFIDSPHGREEPDPALQAMLNNRAYSRTGQRTNPFKVVRYVRSENSRPFKRLIFWLEPSPTRRTRFTWRISLQGTVLLYGPPCLKRARTKRLRNRRGSASTGCRLCTSTSRRVLRGANSKRRHLLRPTINKKVPYVPLRYGAPFCCVAVTCSVRYRSDRGVRAR